MRELCARCRRPQRVCYCRELVPTDTRTRVVLLQHPRERRVPIGTARIAHLALANSELHVGLDFSRHQRVQAVARGEAGRVAILYPSDEAQPVESFQGKVDTLLVVDGTWTTAKKILEHNPVLGTLPRIRLNPTRPGNYRIRKEPEAHCLSTIEAVAEVLGALEGPPARYAPLLQAFDRMVDAQLAHANDRTGPSRYQRDKPSSPRRVWFDGALNQSFGDGVLVYGEANAPSFRATDRFEPELIHLAATRPATGERFEAILRPRHPLASGIPCHTALDAEVLDAGEPVAEALARFTSFRGSSPVLAWGGFVVELLYREGINLRPCIDLRLACSRKLNRGAGGPERAAADLGAPVSAVWAQGRAGRRIAAMEAVARALVASARTQRPEGALEPVLPVEVAG